MANYRHHLLPQQCVPFHGHDAAHEISCDGHGDDVLCNVSVVVNCCVFYCLDNDPRPMYTTLSARSIESAAAANWHRPSDVVSPSCMTVCSRRVSTPVAKSTNPSVAAIVDDAPLPCNVVLVAGCCVFCFNGELSSS
jgi:hypothetical protein